MRVYLVPIEWVPSISSKVSAMLTHTLTITYELDPSRLNMIVKKLGKIWQNAQENWITDQVKKQIEVCHLKITNTKLIISIC